MYYGSLNKHSGANSVLDGGNGDDLIYADYLAPVEGADWVDGGSGSDWLESGGFADFVAGGAGDDVIFGGAGNDYLRGDAGRDAIYGDDGNDELIGGTEADYLEGGAGNDTLLLDGDIGEISTATSGFYGTRVGGAGADVFRVVTGGGGTPGVFLSEGIVAASNLIADFNAGEAGEAIDLSDYTWIRGMSDLSISSQTLGGIQVTTISASNGSDTIYVNLAGVAGELNAGNFKFAAAFGLVLGGAGNDQLPGDAGGNTLDGGAGADAMTGRTGDDTYLVDNAGDTVIELPDGGFDTIKSGVNYTLAANVENLVLTGTATNGTGNDAANRIVGNAANNVLDGKGGVDALLGGAGDDTYVVDSQADAVVEYAGEGRDAVLSSVSYTLGNNIENLTLTGTDSINATGNDLVNTLTGNAGDNILDGAAGVDTMAGGAGDDTYLVDNVGDVVMENVSEGIDTVYSTVNYTLGADVENLVLATGAISGTGNTLDNWLSGNSAANLLTGGAGNDMLDGGVGADTLIGGTGDDTYVVDTAGDVVTELAGEGSDTVVASVSFDLSASPDLESVVLAGTANLNVTGNAADNRLVGNAGVNALSGGAGNDTLDGGAGADALAGGTGDDSYVVDNAGDTVTENAGEGVDSVLSSIGYTLGANLENITLTGGGAINGTGNSLDNTLTGNWNANVLDGEVGNDTLDGGGGADTLIGGAGDDTYKFSVGGGTDTIVDTGGTDQLVFGAGIVASGVTASRTGFQVTLTVSATDSVTFDETIPGQYAVEGIVFAGDTNTVWQASDIRQKVNFAPTGIVGVGGTAIQGQTLTASNTLADADGLGTVSYQWQSSTDGSAWAAIAGATSNTFTLTQAQVGQLVRVNAGYTDGHGTTESIASSPTAVVTGYQAGTANNDSLIGTAYSDTLLGLDGNDTLDGGAGNDTLDGGTGVDTMIGGVGDDRFVVDDSGDVVTENANAGTDTVQSSIAYTLGANVENLTLTGTSDINGTGNSLANSLTGNSGANALSGGIGNDTYVIDNIGDMVIENANAGWDIVKSSITYSLGINVECLMLTGTSAIDGTGNSLANYLAGNSAANTLTGGAGNDQYMDIDGADVVVEKVGEGADWVYSSNSYTLGSNVENLTLTGTAAIDGTGNALNNILIGNGAATRLTGDAGNDTLNGGAGADTMAGGFGDDIYYVDNSGDVVIENLGAGYDRVYSTVSYALIPDVERLDLTGNSAINGTGNASSNWLQGNSQANVLDGGASADLLVGGLGNDTYLFARGYQADRIHDLDKTVGNTDLVSFADGIAADQLWFRHVGNDLEVSIIGTSDKLTIQYWYFNASDYHVEQFKTSTGKLLTDARVENLVQAMAAFSPPAAGQTTLPQSYQDALATTIAANWQ
ncbi:calcium-binding protein [Sulfuritalea sp.]|uniref:calcium-binding protein n=1 Tax=Sulfuritalea sp. TaxID=2480090 RepID=UPI00286E6582|nr:calcium-binding protein [Sulfuritalea sp.]